MTVWIALVVMAIALFANQFITLPAVKSFILSLGRDSTIAQIGDSAVKVVLANLFRIFTPTDYAISAVLFFTLAWLIVIEIRHHRLTEFVDHVLSKPPLTLCLIGLFAIAVTRFYLSPGQVFMGDTETHTVRSWMVAEFLRQGRIPIWSNYWYGGFPLLEYYAPLYLLVTGALGLILGDISTATKLIMWSCHIGSMFAMFAFVRRASGQASAGLISAFSYGLAFHRTHIVIYQGDLQLCVVFLLVPTLLWLIERTLQERTKPKRSFLLVFGVSVALILNHHAYAFFGLIFIGIYLVVRVGFRTGPLSSRLHELAFFYGALAMATLACAFLLIPSVFDTAAIRGMPEVPWKILIPNPHAVVALLPMWTWSPVAGVRTIGYVGISIFVLAGVATAEIIRRRHVIGLALLTAMTFSLFMMQPDVQYNVKNVNFFVIFLCSLTGFALPAVGSLYRRYIGDHSACVRAPIAAKVVVIIIAVLVLDLGVTTFQSVYRDQYRFKALMYERLNQLGNGRVIERQITRFSPEVPPQARFDPTKLGTPSAYAPIQTPLGFFHEAAPLSFAYSVEIVKQLHRELNERRISARTAQGIALLGVTFLVARDRYRYYPVEVEPADYISVKGNIVRFPLTGPILASRRLIDIAALSSYAQANIIEDRQYHDADTYDYHSGTYPDLVAPIIDAMDIELAAGQAEQFIVRNLGTSRSLPGDRPLAVDVLDHEVEIATVAIRYASNQRYYGRLPYSYYDFLDVRVDGEPVSFLESAMHHIVIELPEGTHLITIEGRTSPIRRWAFLFSLVASMAAFLIPARWLSLLLDGSVRAF